MNFMKINNLSFKKKHKYRKFYFERNKIIIWTTFYNVLYFFHLFNLSLLLALRFRLQTYPMAAALSLRAPPPALASAVAFRTISTTLLSIPLKPPFAFSSRALRSSPLPPLPFLPPSRRLPVRACADGGNGASCYRQFDFDLFTIGAGSGGVRASRLAATYGAQVAICELPFSTISSENAGGVGGT